MENTHRVMSLSERLVYFGQHVCELETRHPGALEGFQWYMWDNMEENPFGLLDPVLGLTDSWLLHMMDHVTFQFHEGTAYGVWQDRMLRWDDSTGKWSVDESEDRNVEYPS